MIKKTTPSAFELFKHKNEYISGFFLQSYSQKQRHGNHINSAKMAIILRNENVASKTVTMLLTWYQTQNNSAALLFM